jgi:trk system potassium uptake protein
LHVVVIGCGRVGSELSGALEQAGHTVAVVDKNGRAFRRLPHTFSGKSVVGFGFDRDHLAQAGIEEAGAFASVTNGDNSNILCARIARETYGIEHVVARIYDPRRAEVYQRLGIATVATVRWTADQMLRRLRPEGSESEWSDASGVIRLAEVHVDPSWVGLPVLRIESAAPTRVALITRLGAGMLPKPETVLQEGDLVHVLARAGELDEVSRILSGKPPREEG